MTDEKDAEPYPAGVRIRCRATAIPGILSLLTAKQKLPGVSEIKHPVVHPATLYGSTPAMLYSIDSDGHLHHVSNLLLETIGYAREEVIGRPVTDFFSPATRELASNQTIPELFRVGRISGVERQLICKDGTTIDVLMSAVTTHNVHGRPISLTVLQDVTERNRAQAALIAEHERLQVTLDSIGDGVVTVGRDGNIEYLNPVAEHLTGWPNVCAKRLSFETVFRLIDEITRLPLPTMPLIDRRMADAAIEYNNHAILQSRDGREYWVECSASPIKNTSGDTVGSVLVFRDVSEKVRLHRKLQYRATHDALTGILNRDEFERHLRAAVEAAHCSGTSCALMYIDLDRFKLVNDAGGHAAGDRLLKRIVGLITRFVHHGDTFARLGGDEFALLIQQRHIDEVQGIAERICKEIDAFRFREERRQFHVGASIGLVLIDQHWTTAASVMQAADSACYAAKAAGRNRVHTYVATDEVIESHRGDMQWVRRLEAALDGDQFTLHWQRINCLNDGGGVHGEVLLRLVGEDGKLILPGAFLASAERFQMASRIDRWVVRTVFDLMTRYKDHSAHIDTISINLSGQSIGDRDFHRYVLALLNHYVFDTRKLCFEITETAVITNINEARSFFESMRTRGVRFSLDDFGSGVSSFGYLKALPVDYLKIDGQFIKGLTDDPVDQATVRCIGEVARITGKKTVAEFVETEAVERMLKELGIDYAQGFLRHRPSPIAEMFAL